MFANRIQLLRPAGLLVVSFLFFPVPAVNAADFDVVQAAEILPPPDMSPAFPLFRNAIPSVDGGLLLAGKVSGSSAWLIHMRADGSPLWTTSKDQGWPYYGATALIDAHGGGYWAIGYGQARTTVEGDTSTLTADRLRMLNDARFDYIARLDRSGKQLWQRDLFKGNPRGIYCAREKDNAVYILGRKIERYRDRDDPPKTQVVYLPWIAKLDLAGRVIWEHPLTGPAESLMIDIGDWKTQNCNHLLVSDDGIITMAVPVREIGDVEYEETGSVILPRNYPKHTRLEGTLIAQLDQSGHQLHAFKSAGSISAFLFASKQGYVLLEHTLHFPKLPADVPGNIGKIIIDGVQAMRDSKVRITNLNQDLTKIDSSEGEIPGFTVALSSALPANDGSYFVVGCDFTGSLTMARITSRGTVLATRGIATTGRVGQCPLVGLADGDTKDRILMSMSNEFTGSRLLEIHVDVR